MIRGPATKLRVMNYHYGDLASFHSILMEINAKSINQSLMTWEKINFARAPRSTRPYFLKMVENIQQLFISQEVVVRRCSIFLTHQELTNDNYLWEYLIP